MVPRAPSKIVVLPTHETERLFETATVWAFGFPLGDRFSVIERGPEIAVARGSISALRHDDRDELQQIQTDTPFNPGNSGGPMIDSSGKVVGVPAMILLEQRRINFAVPANYIKKLIQTAPIKKPWEKTGKFTFNVQPEGARIFIDGKPIGSAPKNGKALQVDLVCGYQQVVITHPHYDSLIRDLCLTDGGSLKAELFKRETHIIKIETLKAKTRDGTSEAAEKKNGKSVPKSTLPKPEGKLLNQNFEDPSIIETLEQDTGGTKQRTWYIRDGRLHQHDSNSLLHAVFMGDKALEDFQDS